MEGEQSFVQSAMTSTPSPILTTYIACRYRPMMTLLLTICRTESGWLVGVYRSLSAQIRLSETKTESEALLHFYKLLPLIANLKNITQAQTIRAHYV